MFFSHDEYSTKLTINDKSADYVLGTQTPGSRMVDTNESTELWQHPKLNSKVIASFFCRHLNLGTFFHVLAKCVLPFENDVAEVAAELLQVIVDHVSRFAPQIGIFFVTKIALKRPQHLEQNYWYFC